MKTVRSNEFNNADGLPLKADANFIDPVTGKWSPDGYVPPEKRPQNQVADPNANTTENRKPKPKRDILGATQKGLDTAKEGLGILEGIKGLFSKPKSGTKAPKETGPPPPAPDKGMSTGAIVGISAGVLLLIGIVYVATKKK